MEIIFTKKDIITVNLRFAEGHFNNESSLDYALSEFKRDISWTKKLAYLIRAILIDHVFEEGNKRTACAIMLAYTELNNYRLEEQSAISIIKRMLLKNITSIAKIQGMIEDGIAK